MSRPPSYLELARSGELAHRAEELTRMLSCCSLCPHDCRVDRNQELGRCRIGTAPQLTSWAPRFFEGPLISGPRGSGAVIHGHCTLSCLFCSKPQQDEAPSSGNDFWQVTTTATQGRTITTRDLARIFLALQEKGCHNLNWIAATHQAPVLVAALCEAVEQGLRLPIVYSSNCYDSVELLRQLEGIVDVYCPNLRYSDSDTGEQVSGAKDYPEKARAALVEMDRQVGEEWILGNANTLHRGMLVRFQVMPNDLAGIGSSLRWISTALSPQVGVSLSALYSSCHGLERTTTHPLLNRPISQQEWQMALLTAHQHVLPERLFTTPPA